MSALTAGRDTRQLGVGDNKAILSELSFPQKGSTKCFSGGLMVVGPGLVAAGGQVQPGSTALGLIAAGFADPDPNLGGVSDSTGLADGALNLRVLQGVGALANSGGGDLIAAVNVGQDCYIVDDQTVALTSGGGTRSIAGKIILVDPIDGVYVAVGLQISGSAAAIALQQGTGNPEEIAANAALSVIKRTSRLTVVGTKAYTLADGLIAGQRKTLFCLSASGTPVGVVTPAHASGFHHALPSRTANAAGSNWSGTTSVPGLEDRQPHRHRHRHLVGAAAADTQA